MNKFLQRGLENMTDAVPKRASILIIGDDGHVRSLLENLLAADHDCTVSSSAKDAIRLLEAVKFELVLSDTDLRGINESDLVPYVSHKTPKTVVVMTSGGPTIGAAIRVMPAVAQGETHLSPPIPKLTIKECCSRVDGAGCPLERLTARQTQVLRLIADGKSNKQVALELNISVKTVESHRTQLMDRLEIHDIAGLVRFAIRVGLVRLED